MSINDLRSQAPPPMDGTPNLPAKIVPTKTPWLKLSGRFPMDLRIPPLKLKILLESSPLKSRILVRRLAVKGLDRSLQRRVGSLLMWERLEIETVVTNNKWS